MTAAPWWLPLLELSQVEFRPDPKAEQASGKSAEAIGVLLKARLVRFWEVEGRKRPQLVAVWDGEPRGATTPSTGRGSADEIDTKEVDFPRRPECSDPKLSKLIRLAIGQGKPIWVEGCRRGEVGTEADTLPPTDKLDRESSKVRLLASLPIRPPLRTYIVLEVELGLDANSVHPADREHYLQAFDRLSADSTLVEFAAPGKLQASEATRLPSHISTLHRILDTQRARTIRLLERELSKLEGSQLGSIHSNQALAAKVHQLLDSTGLRVRCPHCGQPAILRCLAAGNTTTGSFVFDHYLEDGRTFHGGRSTFPRLSLIAKPARKLVLKND